MPVRMVDDEPEAFNENNQDGNGGGIMDIVNQFMDPSDNNETYQDNTGSGGSIMDIVNQFTNNNNQGGNNGGGVMDIVSQFTNNNRNNNAGGFDMGDIMNLFNNSRNGEQIDFNNLRDNISNHPQSNNIDWMSTVMKLVQIFRK
ncbi:MAG: hypothetical protein H7Y04_02675 [Verrucomicrobia bacterium]|nr:hypothetical protein [Cytophagales bacterium]